MAKPSISDLKLWVGTLLTKNEWDYNFTKIVSWLSNGEADLVTNSLKATNGIDLDGSNIINLAPATTGSQAVNYDQALSLLDRTSYYKAFSVASGKVDSSGNAAYLQKDSDTQVTVLAGNVNPDLVVVQTDGTVESITANTVLTVGTSNDTYYIVKEKGQSAVITSGNLTVGNTFPTSPVGGDYFADISVAPYKGYKYDAVGGWVATEFCYLGNVVVSSGSATVNPRAYNYFEFIVPPMKSTFTTLLSDTTSKTTLLNLLYPIGSVYLDITSSGTCPIASTLGGTWVQKTGRYLLASGTLVTDSEYYAANTEVAAGLPNITGGFDIRGDQSARMATGTVANGAFSKTTNTDDVPLFENTGGSTQTYCNGVHFDAANGGSSIYGQSTTVRPQAYTVNVWVRTA